MNTIRDIEDFRALDPFFRIIEHGLGGLFDGGHFFDLLAEDVVSLARLSRSLRVVTALNAQH